MASDPSRPSRKVKFGPKQPPRRLALQPKCEVANEDDAVDERNQELLLKKVNDHLTGHRPQTQKKSPVQVVFDPCSSSPLKTFGIQQPLDSEQETSDLPPVVKTDDIVESNPNSTTDKSKKKADDNDETSLNSSSNKPKKKEYIEPWDYKNSFYPITLPLRRPNSGDPEILDEEEFGEKTASMEYDENARNVASELGLRPEDESDEQKMIFFQLPRKLPLHRQTLRPPGGSVAGTSVSGGNAVYRTGGDLESLPAGCMGKLLVYKSGAVKWKMGDHLFDVSPGVACNFQQDVVSINKAGLQCIALGKIEECRAIVTPDDDSLFNA